ncbi:MAG: insulinase family protein [Oligoflexia bacterium]|nr:insulinase family protein [Oligoflexia bacterium]
MKLLSFTLVKVVLLMAINAESFELGKLRFPVERKVLSNGLTILVHEDHTVPTVSFHIWYRVGSRDEDRKYTGIAHLFEHMMFKKAKRYPGNAEKILQANGITNNAFTNYDYTGYFEDLPPQKLELVMDFESDRLENLVIDEETFKSEREVVKEERRFRVDNSVQGVLWENLWSTAFTKHPYSWPVIGWMEDLNRIDVERCRKFFKEHYTATNAVMVVVGDVKASKVFTLADKYFGSLPKVDHKRDEFKPEPPQQSEKIKTVKLESKADQVVVAYRIGKQGEPSSFNLDVLSNILSEGDSSRLFKRLVYHDQSAVRVSGGSITPMDPGLFAVFVELKPGVKAESVLPVITSEIEKAALEEVKKEEVEKARNQLVKSWVSSIKTAHGKARGLALNEVVTGSYETLFDDLKKYQEVNPKSILKSAQQFLKKDNRTVIIVKPKKG